MNRRTDLDGLDRYISLGYAASKLATLFEFSEAYISARKNAGGLFDMIGVPQNVTGIRTAPTAIPQASTEHAKPGRTGQIFSRSQEASKNTALAQPRRQNRKQADHRDNDA